MKSAFNKIIIFLSILMPINAMANYIDSDGIDVVEIVATPWVDSQQTTIQIPESSGNNQYSSVGYAIAMAEKEAAAEKGRKIEACYKQLALLDSSKFACSDDGELIDVVEVVGVKDNDVSQGYAEQDAVRPEPILDPALRPTPQMCYTLSTDLFNCEQRAYDDFTRNSSQCSYAQMMETSGGLGAGLSWLGVWGRSLSAAMAVSGAYLLGDCGGESPETTKGKALSLCAFEARENSATCAIYN